MLSTIALLATGIELWLFGLRFGAGWITAHELSFVAWAGVGSIHVLGYLERAGGDALADLRQALRPEYEQRHHENEQQVRGLKDVADHLMEA